MPLRRVLSLFYHVAIRIDHVENITSQLRQCCVLQSCCWATSMFAEPFLSSGCLFWLLGSYFEQICHNTKYLSFMEQSPFWEGNSHSPNLKSSLPCMEHFTTSHHWFYPIHTHRHCFFKVHSNGILSSLVRSPVHRFLGQNLHVFLITYAYNILYPPHPSWLDEHNNV